MGYLLPILTYVAAAALMGVSAWALVEAAIEMFRHRDFDGIYFYDGGQKFHMSSWFDPLPGDKFYGTR